MSYVRWSHLFIVQKRRLNFLKPLLRNTTVIWVNPCSRISSLFVFSPFFFPFLLWLGNEMACVKWLLRCMLLTGFLYCLISPLDHALKLVSLHPSIDWKGHFLSENVEGSLATMTKHLKYTWYVHSPADLLDKLD